MELNAKIFVAGHNGLVGSSLIRKLNKLGYQHIITRSSDKLDLRNQEQTSDFFQETRPDYVFMAAATVGGILANNNFPADFIFNNLAIQNNVLHAAYQSSVKKLLFLGSSCIYPKMAPQPIKEEYLLTGLLEPTNEPYAIAKIAGIKTCQAYNRQYGCNFISVMPTNLYGPGDNYHLQNAHVLPALIRKFYEAVHTNQPEVKIWGSGNPRREFLYVDDLADALLFLMDNYDSPEVINIGCGTDVSIREVAELLREISCFQGKLVYDTEKPDGTPRKLLCNEKLAGLGWKPVTGLKDGLSKTYADFTQNYNHYIKTKDHRTFTPSTRFEIH